MGDVDDADAPSCPALPPPPLPSPPPPPPRPLPSPRPQPVERAMVNALKDLGWDAFSLHTPFKRHNQDFPQRHGLTLMQVGGPPACCFLF